MLISISFLLSLALGSYWDKSVTELLSFRVEDGWCNPQIQGFGAHCFGDYQLPLSNVRSGEYWETNAYPPIGLAPFFFSSWLLTFLAPQVVLSLYLVFLLASLVTPAIYIVVRGSLGDLSWVTLLVLGAAAHPVIMTLDRGNSGGFVVPALMIFVFSLSGSSYLPSYAVAFAAAWRPQYVLLAFAFIALRQYRRLVAAGFLTISLYFIGFALMPGGLIQNFRSWYRSVSMHGDVEYLFDDGVAKVSFARGLVQSFRWISRLNDDIGQLGLSYLEISYGAWFAPGNLLVLASLLIMIRCSTYVNRTVLTIVCLALPTLVVPVTFGYYNVFVIVIGAIILRSKEENDFISTERTNPLPRPSVLKTFDRWWRNGTVIAVGVTLAPLPIPTTVPLQTLIIEYSGLIWSVIVFFGLANIALSEIEAKR